MALGGTPGSVTVESSTISGNTASGNGFGRGGEIYQTYSVGTPLLRNTIVSDNAVSGASTAGPDLVDELDAAFSLVEDTSDAFINETVAGSNITPAWIQACSRSTRTAGRRGRWLFRGPAPPSTRAHSFGLTTDQRGLARPST